MVRNTATAARKPRTAAAKVASVETVENTLPVTVVAEFETALPIGPDGAVVESAPTTISSVLAFVGADDDSADNGATGFEPTDSIEAELDAKMASSTFDPNNRASYISPKVVAEHASLITPAYPQMLKTLKPFVRTIVTKFMTEALVSGDYDSGTKLAVLSNTLSTPAAAKAAKVVDYDLWVAERVVSLVIAANSILSGLYSPDLAGADQPADLTKVAAHVARIASEEFSAVLQSIAFTADGVETNVGALSEKIATERITARAANAKLAGPIFDAVVALTSTTADGWVTPRSIYTWAKAGNCSDLPNGFASEGAIVARISDGETTIDGLISRVPADGQLAGYRLA